VDSNRAELLAVNDSQHLSPMTPITQPPTKIVEITKDAHLVEKALVFDKPTNKK
jgi:hypothetical protein